MDIIFKTSEFKIKFRNNERTNENTEYIGKYLDAYFSELYSQKMLIVYTTKTDVFMHEMNFNDEHLALYSGFSSDGIPCLRLRLGVKDIKKWNTENDIKIGTLETFKAYSKELANNGKASEKMIFEYNGLEWHDNNIKHSENGDFKEYQIKYFDNASILLENSEKIKELYNTYMF